MYKIVKTRKEHQCGQCGEIIPANERALFHESRVPVYENNYWDHGGDGFGKQIGIWFNRQYRHIVPCLDENGELIVLKTDKK